MTLSLQPQARWVVEYYPVETGAARPDGTVEVDLLVADERWLRRLLLRLAPHARVRLARRSSRRLPGGGTANAQPVRV